MNALLKIGFGGTGVEMAGKKAQYLCSTLISSDIKYIHPSISAGTGCLEQELSSSVCTAPDSFSYRL